MLSRIADSLFWLNRYVERSDTLLRLVYIHYILSLDRSANTNNSWRPVLELCTSLSTEEISEIELDTTKALKKILIDEKDTNSVRSIVNKARENARGVQDYLTKEVWEVVNQMYHQVNQPSLPSKIRPDQEIKVVEALAKSSVLFAGITDNTMSRGLGWNFMQLGKFTERCMQTIAITNKQLEGKSFMEEEINDILRWRYLLFSLSGYELHLKTYRNQDHNASVLHQIILNENFTRSIIYSLTRINYYLENIIMLHEDPNKTLVRSFGRLFSKVKYLDLQTMDMVELPAFLRGIRSDLYLFCNQLGQYYFSYS
jgi:uncharacterized alpha-E superfamily protein